jgi:hypothetical protein
LKKTSRSNATKIAQEKKTLHKTVALPVVQRKRRLARAARPSRRRRAALSPDEAAAERMDVENLIP